MSDATEDSGTPPADDDLDRALQMVRQALRGLRYGEVTVTVQDGVVIQLERLERTRLRRSQRKR